VVPDIAAGAGLFWDIGFTGLAADHGWARRLRGHRHLAGHARRGLIAHYRSVGMSQSCGPLPDRKDAVALIRAAAGRGGLILEHSSGAVGGSVTRVKRLKRGGCGRVKPGLFRARILLAG
jgi:hypothetical protein